MFPNNEAIAVPTFEFSMFKKKHFLKDQFVKKWQIKHSLI